MKRKSFTYRRHATVICFFFGLCVLCPPMNAQTALIPKEVYVGDEAEIRFEFSYEDNLFVSGDTSLSVTAAALEASGAPAGLLSNPDYTVQKITLSGNAPLYVLSFFFVPWKTGSLDVGAFDLASVFEISVQPLPIDIPPVEIQSITAKTGEKNIRQPLGPLIIPGTTYIVFGFCALILIFTAVLVGIFLRLPRIRNFFNPLFARLFSSHNYLKACRGLSVLKKKGASLTPAVFCTRLSSIVRNYLEARFAHPFTAKTTAELTGAFSEFFACSASEKSYECMHNLYEVCARCDYLRFCGKNRIDFPIEERFSLIEKTHTALIYFEQPEEPEENADKNKAEIRSGTPLVHKGGGA